MNRLQLFDTMGNFKKDMPFSLQGVDAGIRDQAAGAQRVRGAGGIVLLGGIFPRSGREIHVRDQRNR